ncbi:polysaccharide-degrading enzyme [Myxococcota bacterium]|nr:polysaccharide-degrading enzyme [Myxococcota bacterium]MBU1508811.1 polysaccharide-degrading enzyme [Myxococcota bacterium]
MIRLLPMSLLLLAWLSSCADGPTTQPALVAPTPTRSRSLPPPNFRTYEVGPGQSFPNLGDVPWESLEPGDWVNIHYRPEPYREKIVLCVQGTVGAPIVIRGIPGPNGELPVISGEDATTRPQLDFWGEDLGVIKIGGASYPADLVPERIELRDLEIRSARPPYSFTGSDGQRTYASNAAAVYIEKGRNIRLTRLRLHDSGIGLFIGSFQGETYGNFVEQCALFDNGIEGSTDEHNSYTSGRNLYFLANWFGPLRAGALGSNLKDRSGGLWVEYNWFEGGNRQLDLVETDSSAIVSDPHYRQTYVYGNVLIEPDGDGNTSIVHYGGDGEDPDIFRKGKLYFYHNTVVSERAGNTTLLKLSTADETAVVLNNVLHVAGSGSSLAVFDGVGTVELGGNCVKAGFVPCHCEPSGVVHDDGSSNALEDPAFVDPSGDDFRLPVNSPCLDHAVELPFPLDLYYFPWDQYQPHQQLVERPYDPPMDPGAFETCKEEPCVRDAGPDIDGICDGTTGTDRFDGADALAPDLDSETPTGDAPQGCSCRAGPPAPGPLSSGPVGFLLYLLVAAAIHRARRR